MNPYIDRGTAPSASSMRDDIGRDPRKPPAEGVVTRSAGVAFPCTPNDEFLEKQYGPVPDCVADLAAAQLECRRLAEISRMYE